MRRRVALLTALMLVACVASATAAEPKAPESSEGLEHLVPELAENLYSLEAGERKFLHRMSFSPAWGRLGAERLFAFRLAYNPNPWLGYEGQIAHNPGKAVPVNYSGSVPDTFRAGREIVVTGKVENGTFMAERNSLVALCPSKFTDDPNQTLAPANPPPGHPSGPGQVMPGAAGPA